MKRDDNLNLSAPMESHPLDTLIPPSLPKTTLFENVNVFDGSSDRLARNMNVLVRGNRIEQVTRQRPASPSNTTAFEVLRGEGRRTLMPGLIDLHVHPMFAVSIADSISEDRDYLVLRAAAAMEATLMRGFTAIDRRRPDGTRWS